MPPPIRDDDDDNENADGRGPRDQDTSSSSRSTASQLGDRSSSLPSVRGTSPTAATPENFRTPPSRTGLVYVGSPPTSATARVSPVPPSTRQPAVPIRPPAFRPVPTQAPGSTGPPSRAQVVRAAAAAVRPAAPGQRATVSQSVRPVASSTRANREHASPVVPYTNPQTFIPPNVRSAAPNSAKNITYARVATASAPTACPPPKSASNAPLHAVKISSAADQSASRKNSSDLRRAAAPLPRHRLASDINTTEVELRRVAKTLFTSPPPPRGSAQDSPAMMSAYSSRQGSDMSAESASSGVDRRDMSPDMSDRTDVDTGEYQAHKKCTNTDKTTDALGFDYEFNLEVATRAQRRPRSPDEDEAEAAKRCCVDPPLPQRTSRGGGGPVSPARYATDGRRHSEPTPKISEPVACDDLVSAPHKTDVNNRSNASASRQATAAAQKKAKKPRYPPLIVEKLPNWAAHFKAVREKLGHPPNARPYQAGIRFLPESAEEYRVVQRYLTDLEKESGLSWFAYSLPAERSVKLAIRGLPADTEIEEIEEELRLHGFEPEYVRHIKARGERPGCIFHAVIKRTPDFRKVYDITTFLYMRGVKIEAWRGKQGPAQCHRCQKFRHSSHLCHRPLACVRCGENHAARDCPRPKTEPATCANCAGEHPASNPRCPVYIQEAKNRRAGTVASTKRATQNARNNNMQSANKATNAEEKETPSESLMAAANGPTNRQEAPSGRRRNNRRGGKKGKQSQPPTVIETKIGTTNVVTHEAQAAAQTAPVAAEQKPKRQRSQGKARQTQEAQGAQSFAPATQTKKVTVAAPSQQRQAPTNTEKYSQPIQKPRHEFTACAIKLLMDLIKAIRQGQDVELVILDGLAELLQMYHG